MHICRFEQVSASGQLSQISPRLTTHILQVGAPMSAASWSAIRPSDALETRAASDLVENMAYSTFTGCWHLNVIF